MLVIENFLDKELFSAIGASPFWRDPSFYWHSIDELDNTIGSSVVRELASRFPMKDVVGFEYWPGVLTPDTPVETTDGVKYHLDIHVDKDELLYSRTGEMVYPLWGAVLYWCEDVEGGELRYWLSKDEFQDIPPASNQLIVFDPTAPHGVLEVSAGVRRALSINFWGHIPTLS
ncbi:MAG: 2OG-Fe(II) oxygenase [Alphaproteobacteria bacterium]